MTCVPWNTLGVKAKLRCAICVHSSSKKGYVQTQRFFKILVSWRLFCSQGYPVGSVGRGLTFHSCVLGLILSISMRDGYGSQVGQRWLFSGH